VNKTARIAAVAAVAALTLAGCGERPADDDKTGSASDTPSASETPRSSEQFPDFKACIISDSGGFDDKSFNQTSYAGLVNAKEHYGVQTAQVESNSDTEYPSNIKEMVKAGCNSITTVGFLLGDATEKAAKKSPKIDFSIVDFAYEKPAKNLKGLTFATDQPSFLAGYVAAGSSETGTVGTFGGMQIPTVTIFMDGFAKGVAYYNEQNDADVQVLGWDTEKQSGSFTDDFEDKAKGQTTAEQMIQQGADVIFPVAGPAGLGGLQAAKDGDVKAIWVDTDGCQSASEYCDVLLTSVMKAMDVAVEEAILQAASGEFSNELYVGTLENNGVGLADLSDDVPSEVADAVEELKAGIIDGSISLD
jgi:basic membrane protein A